MSDNVSKPSDLLNYADETPALNQCGHEELIEQLNAAEQKTAEYWERILRMQADTENLMRRCERDVSNAHKYSLERFLADLLPIIDNLERGLTAAAEYQDSSPVVDGVKLTMRMMQDLLSKNGITIVDPVGAMFDHNLHEAVSVQEAQDQQAGAVITVLQKGYSLNGRLVRPAMVIVAK